MTVEELKIILKVNGASTYTHTVNEVTNVTNNYKNSIGGLTSMFAKLVSTALITRFAKQCITAASDLQEVANVTNVTFGKSAAVIDAWTKSNAANFGLSETASKRYIGTFGTMARQFNFTEEQAAQMGIELTKLTGDVASFYNITDSLAATKLKSVFTGETETLKELGVVMTEAQLNAYAMSKGIGKTVKDMSEQEKVMLRYRFTMEKLGHAQGDFARTSDGWANSVRRLNLNLENLKIQIGNELLPVAGQGLAALTDGLQAISPIVLTIAQTVRLYTEAWKNASEVTRTFVKLSVGAFGLMIVAPRIIMLTSTAVKLLTMDIVTLGGAMKALFGIAGVVLAIASIAALSKQVNELRASEPAADINALGDSAEISANAVDDLAESIDTLNGSTAEMGRFLASFDEVNKVGDSGSLMSNLVNSEDLANIAGAASGFGDLNSIIDELNTSVDNFSTDQIFTPDWWEEKKKFFTGYWDYLKQSFSDGSWKEDYISALEEIGGWFEENFPGWSKFWEGIGEKVHGVTDEIADLAEKVKGFITGWNEAYQGLGEKIYDATHKEDGSSKSWGNIWSGVGEKVYDATHQTNSTKAGGLLLAGPSIASLAINSGTDRNQSIGNSQTANVTPQAFMFQPTIQIDGRKITATVIDSINEMTRSSGNSPLIQLG